MELRNLIDGYLNRAHMMQLATSSGSQPWSCTVYYVFDKELNIYWLSLPLRRHSKEIEENHKASIAIAVQYSIYKKVIGLQAQGRAEILRSSAKLKPLAEEYAKKFNRSDKWVVDFINNKTNHKMYKFTPDLFVLFDDENFIDRPRQELKIK